MLSAPQEQFLTELYELCQRHQFSADLSGISSALRCQSLSVVIYLKVHCSEQEKPTDLKKDYITAQL